VILDAGGLSGLLGSARISRAGRARASVGLKVNIAIAGNPDAAFMPHEVCPVLVAPRQGKRNFRSLH
jgi:hypothetical protein